MKRSVIRFILFCVFAMGIVIAIPKLTYLKQVFMERYYTSFTSETFVQSLTDSDKMWFSKAEQAEDSYAKHGEDQDRLDAIWKKLYIEHSELTPTENLYLIRRAEIKPMMDQINQTVNAIRSFTNDATITAYKNNPSIDQLGFAAIQWKGKRYLITQQKINGDHYIAIDVRAREMEYVYRNGSLLKK